MGNNSSDEEYLYLLKLSNQSNPCANITVKSRQIKMTIDTGASINVIDEVTFGRLGDIQSKKAGITAYTYGSHPVATTQCNVMENSPPYWKVKRRWS